MSDRETPAAGLPPVREALGGEVKGGDEPTGGDELTLLGEEARGDPESPALLAAADPMARSLALPGLQAGSVQPPSSMDAWPPGLEGLLERMVRRAQWGGDGRRGTARIELGSGALAGGVLLVTFEQGELSIDLDLPPGVTPDAIGERLRERLGAKGLVVGSFTVS